MCSVRSQQEALTIEVIGQLVVTRDGVRQELPRSRKTRGLLAYLALQSGTSRRDELCSLLWDGASDPRGELRWSLAKIKNVVGPWLDVSHDGIGLRAEKLRVDAADFRQLASAVPTRKSVGDALALWHGSPLADVDVEGQLAFNAWLSVERDALSGLRSQLLRAAVDLAWDVPAEALAAARRLVLAEPWNEWGNARVVQLLERSGRTTEAADYMALTRRRLSGELGVPEAKILATLPSAPRNTDGIVVGRQRPRARPLVRVEKLQVVSTGASADAIGVMMAATLTSVLWRRGCCDVVDGKRSPRAQFEGTAEPEFAIRGSVVRDESVVFLSLRLVGLRSGTLIWSGQDQVREPSATDISSWVEDSIESMVVAFRRGRYEANDPNDIRNRLVRATALTGALQPESNQQALALLNGVLAEDADDPAALALVSWCYAQRAVYNWSPHPDRERREARYYAAAATNDGIDDPRVLTTIATARTLVKEANAAQVLLERALRLNGRSAYAHTRSGWLANFTDKPEVAVRHFRTAIRLAPLDPAVFNAYAGLGAAHFIQGNYIEAIRRMEQALALNPKAVWIQRNLVPAYSAVGDRRNAEEGVEALTRGYPHLTVSDIIGAVVFSAPVLTKMASGLREAGLPA